MTAPQPGTSSKWRIEPVGDNFKVVFIHDGSSYELGLFSSKEEGTRVADVLTSEFGVWLLDKHGASGRRGGGQSAASHRRA